MGCGTSVVRSSPSSGKPLTSFGQRTKIHTETVEVPKLISLSENQMSNSPSQDNDDMKIVHIIDIKNGSFTDKLPDAIRCDDIVEFKINGKDEYDIIQVYKDGNDYYRVVNGYQLLHINSRTSAKDRRIIFSLDLNQSEIDLYFCIIPPSPRQNVPTIRKFPRTNCEHNCLKIHQNEIPIALTDERLNQQVYAHKGDTIEITWSTKHGYRIEERKYCPASGGLYTVEQTPGKATNRCSTNGKFSKTFHEFGMSFLIRLTDTNQIHDITVCVINETYKMKHVEITDNDIQPNIIWIEQSDSIAFDWETKRKQTIVQIEPFTIDMNKQQSIELKTVDKHLFWPYEPSRRGYMHYQFNETGIFCYKTGSGQIGTIIVEPRKSIFHIPAFSDQQVYKMNTNDLVQFDWRVNGSDEEPILITIDPLSSVVPNAFGGVTGVFDCAGHKCTKVDQVLHNHFHTCETLLLSIPQHGLYNFACSNDHNKTLLSLIVENGFDSHRVVYNEHNAFEPHTLIINRLDQVWFDSSSTKVAAIYQTDEFGNEFETNQPIFHPQPNSINYFMKEFTELGIYYFATEKNDHDKENHEQTSTYPLAIIVLPEVTFHYKTISKNNFDHRSTITNVNDFVIWYSEDIISHNLLHIHSDETLQGLITCHDRAVAGRKRRCLAVECVQPGTFFFANPEFERVTGAEDDRLIATIIIEPPFSQNCFVIANGHFIPNVLHIAQNDTISWTLSKNERNQRIYVQPADDEQEDIDEGDVIQRNITDHVHNVHYLHTFHKPGKYTIRSDRSENPATVFVYPEQNVRSQKKRVQQPELCEEIHTVSHYGTRVHLVCPNRNANIYYTLDGSTPTRHYSNVQEYDPSNGVVLNEQGLRVIRAYSTEAQKISSTIMTSSPTFIMQTEEVVPPQQNELNNLWNDCKITLSAKLQSPNKLYGNIEIEPNNGRDLIDHFELYINDVAHRECLAPTDIQFSAEGFAGGDQYEIYIIAHPKKTTANLQPIPSNKRAFEIERQTSSNGPLISLSVSDDPNALRLMWAHIGDPVVEYSIYVDDIKKKTLSKAQFNNLFGIQFEGTQHRRNYSLHVEAKIENGNDIRKSNVISVTTPMKPTINRSVGDEYFPYITINSERTPSGRHLKTVELSHFAKQRSQSFRTDEHLPITNDVTKEPPPTISYQSNTNGITLSWKKQSQAITNSIQNYRIMVDRKQYGKLLAPNDEPSYQINLSSGKHECYLDVISKDENEEILRSNVLKIDLPSMERLESEQRKQQTESSDVPVVEKRLERKQQTEPAEIPVEVKRLEQKDLPRPKLSLQTMNPSSISAEWTFDRPIPANASVDRCELHVRGQEFPNQMTSDENSKQGDYIDHVWHVHESPFEITGISERYDYKVSVRAFFRAEGSNDSEYLTTTSNEVTKKRIPLIDLLSIPLVKVTRVGLQMASLSWELDDSADKSLVKGYRIIVNSKPIETLPPNQHEYELCNIKPGTTNAIQVSVTADRHFTETKISEPINIVCPQRPKPPTIQGVLSEKPFGIRIKWNINDHEQDDISSFKIFLDGKVHGEIEVNGRHSFKYDFTKLQPDQTYAMFIKTLLGQKKLEGNTYQCEVESNASNELVMKSAIPPKGTTPKIERMHANGVDIVWDAPVEQGDVKLTGYQVLKDGRSIGKSLPLDKRRASVNDLQIGNRYSIQIVPITNQPGGTLFRAGEEYDPERHGHYIPGDKLEVEYTDLVALPTKFWVERIAGRSALVCWSPIDASLVSNELPDGYKLLIWNNKEYTRDKPMINQLSKDKTSAQLKDLQSNTLYELKLEGYKKRRHPTTNDSYLVSSATDELNLTTGAPPDPPSTLHLIACTNTDVRVVFDRFIEHNAEIKALRVQYEPISSEGNAREMSMDITPDSAEFILSNLTERTEYNVTIYAITEEYLNENGCREVSQLPKKLKPSEWLPNKNLHFQTSGCEPSKQLTIRQATTESIQLQWTLGKVYGSTQFIGQTIRWQLEHGGEEHTMELNQNATNATIPGPLPSGVYKISLDSLFNVKINLEDDDDETSRKELRLTTNVTTTVRFQAPAARDRPEIYLTGYTMNTIDLTWNKPNMFDVIDHPEKNNEQLKIHRRLVGYRVDINGRKHNTIDENNNRCTLTDCHPGEEYKVQLTARTIVQNEYINDTITNGKENTKEPDETPSKILPVQMLKKKDLLRSFQANFEFNHNESNENITKQPNEVKSLGKIHVNWSVSDTKDISHFILQWRSSKDLRIQEKTVASNETSSTIDSCDEKYFYVIEIIIVNNDGNRYQYEQLTIPIPGAPDAPKLWLVKTTDTNFIVEWSEPKSYGIPVIGFQLFIEGKKAGDMIEINSRRAEIPSRINRTYQINVCALTNNPQCLHSQMSEKLTVITTPTTALIPTMYYNNDDGSPTSFDRTIARIIPLQIESINEEKLHIDWTSFLHTSAIRAYYIHYTCLNNGEVQAMKVSKRFRHAVLRGLRPGFTYGIMVMAVDKNGGVLYTSDKATAQMNAPPNAPIVAISERTTNHVKLEWRPAASYGEVMVAGYKIFVNNRLAAILTQDQLSYILTNGTPCDTYTVHVQALSNNNNIVSPMSRGVQFSWPGIKPGTFRRIDDGQSETIVVAWEHPRLEDESEKLLGFKLYSENIATRVVRLHGEYDAGIYQATIDGLNNGKYLVWLEIQSEQNRARSRPITITSGRFSSLTNRRTSVDAAKCRFTKQKRFRSPSAKTMTPPLRQIQYS